jgi:hypothetical protein
MTILGSLAIITFAAIIHTSFQLSLSVLTLLSGHTIGANHSHKKLLHLSSSFVLGVGFMTLLLTSSTSFIVTSLFNDTTPKIIWAVCSGLLFGVAMSVWLFYYKRNKGTALWIPRSFASYLHDRTKATKSGAESFSLGLSSVVGELLFIFAPILISSLTIAQLPHAWQIVAVVAYTLVSLLSVIVIWILIGSGHSLGKIQEWRESNKYFLQFASGAGLIILGMFVYAYQVIGIGAVVS